jgi:hypothetical protein
MWCMSPILPANAIMGFANVCLLHQGLHRGARNSGLDSNPPPPSTPPTPTYSPFLSRSVKTRSLHRTKKTCICDSESPSQWLCLYVWDSGKRLLCWIAGNSPRETLESRPRIGVFVESVTLEGWLHLSMLLNFSSLAGKVRAEGLGLFPRASSARRNVPPPLPFRTPPPAVGFPLDKDVPILFWTLLGSRTPM